MTAKPVFTATNTADAHTKEQQAYRLSFRKISKPAAPDSQNDRQITIKKNRAKALSFRPTTFLIQADSQKVVLTNIQTIR